MKKNYIYIYIFQKWSFWVESDSLFGKIYFLFSNEDEVHHAGPRHEPTGVYYSPAERDIVLVAMADRVTGEKREMLFTWMSKSRTIDLQWTVRISFVFYLFVVEESWILITKESCIAWSTWAQITYSVFLGLFLPSLSIVAHGPRLWKRFLSLSSFDIKSN